MKRTLTVGALILLLLGILPEAYAELQGYEKGKGYHFFNHQNYGAYDFLTKVNENGNMTSTIYEIAYLINYHDSAYQMPPKTLRKRFGDHADLLSAFHKVDVKASVRDEGVVEHYSWEEK